MTLPFLKKKTAGPPVNGPTDGRRSICWIPTAPCQLSIWAETPAYISETYPICLLILQMAANLAYNTPNQTFQTPANSQYSPIIAQNSQISKLPPFSQFPSTIENPHRFLGEINCTSSSSSSAQRPSPPWVVE